MRKTTGITGITAIAMVLFSLVSGSAYARQRGAAPEMLFSMSIQNDMRLPLSQTTVTTPNVDLQLYGDGRNIIVATGTNAPRTL